MLLPDYVVKLELVLEETVKFSSTVICFYIPTSKIQLPVFYSNFNFNHSKYAVLSHCCFNYYILKVCISYSFPNFLTNLFLILTIGFFKIHYQSFLVLKTNGVIFFFPKSQTLGA